MAKWGRRMGLGLIGLIVAVVGLWAGYTYFYEGNLGQPAYLVTAQRDGVEYRQYEPFVIASIQTTQGGDSGLRSGFRLLAGYIFGSVILCFAAFGVGIILMRQIGLS